MKGQAIGQRVLRPDAVDKVTGRARFPGDLTMEGMLFVKVLFSDRAHARIVSMDASEAEQVPGVVAILTHKDVPVNEYGLIYKDQPALSGDRVRSDPREAMKPGAPVLHERWPDNVQSHQRIRRGDVEAVFARDDVVIVESDYFTPHQEHAYLQPEAGIGYIDEQGRVAVHSAGQWSHDDQHQIAHIVAPLCNNAQSECTG